MNIYDSETMEIIGTTDVHFDACPFCGGPVMVSKDNTIPDDPMVYDVMCLTCCAKIEAAESINELAEWWNRRRSCTVVEVKPSEKMVKECLLSCGHWTTTFMRYCPHCGAKVV